MKSMLKHLARALGVEVKRYRPGSSEDAQLMALLSRHAVDLVLDVGANTGQYSQFLRQAGYSGRIVSFEPLAEAYSTLLRASASDESWDIAQRAAIGSTDGAIDIQVAMNSVTSSILPLARDFAAAQPTWRPTKLESVPLRRLDSLAAPYLSATCRPFLKIDTQGYEDQVLVGAPRVLDRVLGLQLELSLVAIYDGQCLFDDMITNLRNRGFVPWALWPGYSDPVSGRMLQVEGVFLRAD